MNLERITGNLNLSRDSLEASAKVLARAGLVVGIAYAAASMLSAYIMAGMLSSSMATFTRMSARQTQTASLSLSSGGDNYRDIVKAVRERNLFNSTGEFPEEKAPGEGETQQKSDVFNIDAPCSKPSINVELVGTIYLEGGESIATLQEQGYSESDVYREGDAIVGNDQASIARIERNRVILNNRGVKECLELAATTKKEGGGAFPDVAPIPPPDGGMASAPPGSGGGGGGSSDCQLEEKFVQDELGPGFGTIIQKARLVPNTADNAMNGFKIFAISPGSLFEKMGLRNGDIITQVNDVSLKQPEQGFALYQSLQDEKEVRIQLLRGGTTPTTINCRTK